MPKLKTNRGAAKRFIKTGSGKFKRAAANHNHILTKKGQKRKRRLRKLQQVDKTNMKAVVNMLRT